MRPTGWWLAALLACKGDPTPAPTSTNASGSAPPPPVAAAADAAIIVVDAAQTTVRDSATRCRTPCLYLVDVPLAEAKQAVVRDCKLDWPYDDDDCEMLLTARNCIYAAHGKVFKKPDWKQVFEGAAWYRPRPDFRESDFTATARANVKELVDAHEACKPWPTTPTPEDIALGKAWFERLRTGDKGDSALDDVDVEEFAKQWENYAIDERTTFSYVDKPYADRRELAIERLYHAVGGGETDRDAIARLVFDKSNRLIEAH